MYNNTCSIYQEVSGFDEINAPVKTRVLLYSSVTYRTRHLSAAEVNANGAERGRQTHRIYIPYAPYPLIDTASRITMDDGGEFDVIHSDNVDEQNLFWEIDARMCNQSNAEVAWSTNPIGPALSITATVTDIGIFTSAGFSTVLINNLATNNLIPIYLGPVTGTADPLNIFYGTTQNTGNFAQSYYISVLINNIQYWMPIYTWDSAIGGGSTTINGTINWTGTYTSAGFVKSYLNGMATSVWIPIYNRN